MFQGVSSFEFRDLKFGSGLTWVVAVFPEMGLDIRASESGNTIVITYRWPTALFACGWNQRVSVTKDDKFELLPASKTRFFRQGDSAQYLFVWDRSGHVIGHEYHAEGVHIKHKKR